MQVNDAVVFRVSRPFHLPTTFAVTCAHINARNAVPMGLEAQRGQQGVRDTSHKQCLKGNVGPHRVTLPVIMYSAFQALLCKI